MFHRQLIIMSNKTSKSWGDIFSSFPKWIQDSLKAIGWVLKIPNFVWNLPGLSKLKGVRLLLLTVLAVIYKLMSAFDYNILADTVCGMFAMFQKECDTEKIVAVITELYVWLAAALAVEDKSTK